MKKSKRLIILEILFLLILPSKNLFAQLDSGDFYLQKILRNSSVKRSTYFNKDNYKYINLDLNLTGSKNIKELNSLFDTDDNEEIINYLDNNYGSRFLVETNNYLGLKFFNNKIELSTSGGALLDINNPIMPEIDGKFLHDINLNYSRIFNYKKYKIEPKLIVGKRKFYNTKITPGDFLKEEKFKFKWNDYKYKNFIDFDLTLEHKYKRFTFRHELRSVPIAGYRPINYWLLNTGINYDIVEDKLFNLSSWLKFSPLYYGDYDWKKQIEYGVTGNILNFLTLTVAQQYEGLLSNLDIDLKLIRIGIFYKKPNVNDFDYSQDLFGAQFSLKW